MSNAPGKPVSFSRPKVGPRKRPGDQHLPTSRRMSQQDPHFYFRCDTRAFLAWLRASCPSGLTAQLKAEKLMVVASTANGF